MDPDGMLRDSRRLRDDFIYGEGHLEYRPDYRAKMQSSFSGIKSFFSKLFQRKKK